MGAKGKTAVMAVAVAIAAVVLSGCGGDKKDGAAPLVKPVVTTSAAAAPFQDLTADEVLRRAETSMKAASSMTVDMSFVSDGKPMQIKEALTGSGKCAAAMRIEGTAFQIIAIGTTGYLKADAHYWETKGGSKGKAVAPLLAGKWVKLPPKLYAQSGFDTLCTIKGMIGTMSSDDNEGTLVKGHPTVLDGRPVLPLIHHKSGDVTTVYVTTTGNPYVVKVVTPSGPDRGSGTFGGFGKPAHIAAPPRSQTVDLSAYTGPDGDGFSV